MKIGRVYCLVHTATSRMYVGQTWRSLEIRFKGHSRAEKERGKFHIQHAIRRYGIAAFSMVEMCTAQTQEDLDAAEKYWVSYFQSNNPQFGFNMTVGGKGAKITSKQSRREDDKRGLHMRGRKLTDEWKDNLSLANYVRWENLETRKRQSEISKAAWDKRRAAGTTSPKKKRHW